MTRAEALRILGLQPGATPTEVKRAYRQLVKEVHPDKNPAPNAEQRFKHVQEAYEFISVTEEQGRTKERVAREYRDRAASEAWARAAREWAEREARQREERERAEKEAKERADRERKAREAKEKAAKEAEAQREWEQQRTMSAQIPGVIYFLFLILLWTLMIVVGLATFWLLFMIRLKGGWHAVGVIFALGVSGGIPMYLFYLIEKRVTEYQLRKFEKNHPPPCKETTERTTDNDA